MVLYSFLQSSPNACGFFYLDFGHVGFKADYTSIFSWTQCQLLSHLPLPFPSSHFLSTTSVHLFPLLSPVLFVLCTYQCKSCWGGGMQARGGDLMPETIPPVGLLIVRSDPGAPGSGYLTLTDRSLVSIQNCLLSQSLEAF